MDDRQENIQQCRHHRAEQAGDAVGGVEQPVDRLLGVAVAHQGGDGGLQRRQNTMRSDARPTEEIISSVIDRPEK